MTDQSQSAIIEVKVSPKRLGRPPVGPATKTHEEHLERMRNNSRRYTEDAREFRRLMSALPQPMTVDEILARLNMNMVMVPV